MKTEYRIYEFDIKSVQEAQDWLNEKAKDGFVILNIHYYKGYLFETVRYTLERKA
ncbi:hypothetical protein [Flavobacterium taihuense]|uniref:DUF4177 domain-containing protein n=1 Tax=Flavobacterium taihuense TaxID=2857508 RepID=A0ABS6Y3Y8_9FLAO|nr:hypothetical protein [Flavobacterium taihuense]MBW4362793.1 hypothetical protein [Flavobacterium taihuense]